MNYISVSSIPTNQASKVSVVMVTYNHESFIARSIEGVLSQQTTFPIELVIGEDCSPDNTRDILVEYQRRHPDKVRLLLWNRNAGAALNFKETLSACHGQYIAFCEGDDYWTDPHKLQRQVDLLDGRKDLALCHHLVDYVNWENGIRKVLFSHPPEIYHGTRTARDLMSCNFIQTCSLVVRRSCLPVLDSRYLALRVGDWPLSVLVAEHGDIGFLETSMADYRIHDNNGWYQQTSDHHRFESARVCMYLASVAKPGARDLWRTKGISMLRLLMDEQPEFQDAANMAWVAWRTRSVSFPQAFRLLERYSEKRLYSLESSLESRKDEIEARKAEIRSCRDEIQRLNAVVQSARNWQKRSSLTRAFHKWRGPGTSPVKIHPLTRLIGHFRKGLKRIRLPR